MNFLKERLIGFVKRSVKNEGSVLNYLALP